MHLRGLEGGEENPAYQRMATDNYARHFSFLLSAVQAAVDTKHIGLSESLIKAINLHAIVCLHREAGDYRSVQVTVGEFEPPAHGEVNSLMGNLIEVVNRKWQEMSPVNLSAFVLWGLNYIHPFVNGNGRTARAICYYVLCVKLGGLLPGDTIIPEILRTEPVRSRYVQALRAADAGNMSPLIEVVSQAITQQVATDGGGS